MNLKRNKKGSVPILMIGLIVLGIIGFVFVLAYSMFIGAMNQVNTALRGNGNEMVGQVNLTSSTDSTFGMFNTGLQNSANLIGIVVMFGMFIGLMISAYFRRSESKIIFIFLDIFLVVIAYIFSSYISNIYEESILTVSDLSTDIVSYMPGASQFLLKLPVIVFIVGVIILIISHSAIPSNREDETFISG